MSGSGFRIGLRRPGRPALLLALALAAGCAAKGESGTTWEVRLAEGELLRAQEAEAKGERERAVELGRRSLQRAREAADLGTIGRALLFVGRLEPDLVACLDAITVFQGLGDEAGAVEARVAAAEALLAIDRDGEALDQLAAAEAALERADLDRLRWARLEAPLQHTAARALRRLGRHDDAHSRERRAALALSLLDDLEALPLRIGVETGLADDALAADEPIEAIEHFSRALYLGRRSGDRVVEVESLTGIVASLTSLRRYADAAAHCERALALAWELDDPPRVQALGRRGLELLARLGESDGSARWRGFEQALLAGD